MIEAVPSPDPQETAPPPVQFGIADPGLRFAAAERVADLDDDDELALPDELRILNGFAEFYDDDTPAHSMRVGRTAALLARAIGLDEGFVHQIRLAAPLHDVGKIGISRRVLLKPEALTTFERENVMRHVEIGARLLRSGQTPYLLLAAQIARTHHERWNGEGYMIGLEGEEIPLAGRITAVADVFDVLTHVRPYKPAWPVEQAVEEIVAQAGRQFDPHVVAAFQTLDPEALLELPVGDPARPLRASDRIGDLL